MIVKCYQIAGGPQLLPCAYDAAIEAVRGGEMAGMWIDLLSAEISELEAVLDDLNVQGLIRRFCLEAQDHPGYYPLKPISYLVMPVLAESQDAGKMEYMAFVYCKDFLLTFRNEEMIRFQKSFTLQEYASLLPEASLAGLVASFVLGLSLVALRKASYLSENVLKLEEKMNRNPGSMEIEEISGKRLELLSFESVVHGQLPIVQALVSSDKPWMNVDSTRDYLIWASANLQSADRSLEWLERRIDVMRSFFDAYAQETINKRLGRLTVLSSIFMPITFLAGIWGMNFEFMPGLAFRYGYAMALLVMMLIGGGMYLSFRRMGWFD
jgi:magnesium transporter